MEAILLISMLRDSNQLIYCDKAAQSFFSIESDGFPVPIINYKFNGEKSNFSFLTQTLNKQKEIFLHGTATQIVHLNGEDYIHIMSIDHPKQNKSNLHKTYLHDLSNALLEISFGIQLVENQCTNLDDVTKTSINQSITNAQQLIKKLKEER